MEVTEPFPCLMIRQEDGQGVRSSIEQLRLDDLPEGEVVVEVDYSSLNYKDALACRGHEGVVSSFPHVPGIDCAGHVAGSTHHEYHPGDSVLITGYDLGAASWGGYSRYVRVPAEWVVHLPGGLTIEETMIYGTAGFTAAQCVAALIHEGVDPEDGEIVVTGATGGVGSVAIAILAELEYQVVAATGKAEQAPMLQSLGARRIVSREEVASTSDNPLLKATWAGGVDTVGGDTLATLLRSTKHRGCIAACGLAGGDHLPLTVYPFILRGISLRGIDSAKCPRNSRMEIWWQLAGDWNVVEKLKPYAHEISLNEVPARVDAMLTGTTHGRTLVRLKP